MDRLVRYNLTRDRSLDLLVCDEISEENQGTTALQTKNVDFYFGVGGGVGGVDDVGGVGGSRRGLLFMARLKRYRHKH